MSALKKRSMKSCKWLMFFTFVAIAQIFHIDHTNEPHDIREKKATLITLEPVTCSELVPGDPSPLVKQTIVKLEDLNDFSFESTMRMPGGLIDMNLMDVPNEEVKKEEISHSTQFYPYVKFPFVLDITDIFLQGGYFSNDFCRRRLQATTEKEIERETHSHPISPPHYPHPYPTLPNPALPPPPYAPHYTPLRPTINPPT